MNYLFELKAKDYERMAAQIQSLSESQSEEDLFGTIGNGLHDMGLTVSNSTGYDIVKQKVFNQEDEGLALTKSFEFVNNTEPLSKEEAKKEGGKFWKRFKEKLRVAICNNSKIRELLDGNGNLKDYLTVGIPLVLAALGVGVLNPVWLAIIASVFALIVKVGFDVYCERTQA